jgi:hypothetical protein
MTQESLIQKKRKREEQDRTGQERDFRLFIQFFFHFHSLHSLFIIIIACFCAWGGAIAFPLLGCFKKKLAGISSPPIFLRPFKSTSPNPGATLFSLRPFFCFFFSMKKHFARPLRDFPNMVRPRKTDLLMGELVCSPRWFIY